MSMTVQIAMQGITDLEILLSALREMGIKVNCPDVNLKNSGDNVLAYADIGTRQVQFVQHKNGEINMVGDSDWRIIKDKSFQQKLKQQYSLETVKQKVTELRYNLASVETLENGAIKLVARAWR